MRKIVYFIAAIMLFSSFPYGFAFHESETLSFEYEFGEPQLIREGKEWHIQINGCNDYEYNGNVIPAKKVHLLVPFGKNVRNVEIKTYGREIIGSLPLKRPEPLIVDGMMSKTPKAGDVEKNYEIVGVYSLRGYKILVMNLFPVSYEDGVVSLYRKMEVRVELQEGKNPLYRGIQKDREWVAEYVDNPWIIETYPPKNCDEKYDYVIITGEKFVDAFQRFVDYKESKGINTTIFTVEDIEINPSFWNSTPMFNDTAAKIRNFIRYAYLNWGIDYVLLGGDADVMNASSNIVPARRLYATCVGLPLATTDVLEGYLPSDVYYACLDGSFNKDMDDKWGENATGNDVDDTDEADLYADVWVGRVCVDSIEEVNNFINKTIAYEESNNERALMQILMVGEYLGFGGAADWGSNHLEKVVPFIPPSYNITRLYEKERGWDKHTLASIMNNGVNIVNHLGHGWTTYALKMHNGDLKLLDNDDYFFLYSQTCLAGSFDNWYPEDHYYDDDCFAEHLTLDKHGAFACIMNSRYGLGRENSTDSPGQRFDTSFFKALFQENIRELGRANHYSKEDNIWRINENGMRWIYYETNLFGDPQVAIKEPSQRVEINVSIKKPGSGIYIFDMGPIMPSLNSTVIIGAITIEANVSTNPTGYLERVKIYVDDELKASIESSPYRWRWDERVRGTHRIVVEACATNGKCERAEKEIFIINI